MMMCDLLIVIDPKHPDRNSLDELVSALECMNATIVEIDTARHVIEAVVPATQFETLHHLGGVSYVRPVFSYHCPPKRAA
jgi:hypothetical protein